MNGLNVYPQNSYIEIVIPKVILGGGHLEQRILLIVSSHEGVFWITVMYTTILLIHFSIDRQSRTVSTFWLLCYASVYRNPVFNSLDIYSKVKILGPMVVLFRCHGYFNAVCHLPCISFISEMSSLCCTLSLL